MSSRPRFDYLHGLRRPTRRRLNLTLLLSLVELALTRTGAAQSLQIPVSVQAGLIAKVAAFDRNFAARAGGKAVILLPAMPNDAESMRAVLEMKAALSEIGRIGDFPHEEEIVTYGSAQALADLVRARRAAIVYFGPGFGKQMVAIRDAFSSVNVLTIGALAEYVSAGVVLGFDLVSGRPKLVIHLGQARRQQVAFPASVLNLMKVIS